MVSRHDNYNVVSANVDDDLADRITECLKKNGELTQSQLVREALRDKLEDYE